jgi:hypothetical protein
MTKVSFSSQALSLSEIWQWYQHEDKALDDYQAKIIKANVSGVNVPDFFGMAKDEIIEYFSWQKEELDRLVSLNLIASAEASLRIDYLTRVYERRKDILSREFRNLYKQKGTRASLEDDILKTWKQQHPTSKSAIGHFIGTLNLRHWLAHGRYWIPKFGRQYNPKDVFEIAENLFDVLPDDFSWAIN